MCHQLAARLSQAVHDAAWPDAKPTGETRSMMTLIKLLHLVAAIFWVGGMTFMLLALRPAALRTLEPQPRARLMEAVWARFFPMVLGAVVLLLVTGGHMYAATYRVLKAAGTGVGMGIMPLGWNLMAWIGLLMALLFGHIFFAGFKKYRRAVQAADWPAAAKAAGQIHALVVANFVLGWLAIASVRLLG
jgi:uncharacterized membrane protein